MTHDEFINFTQKRREKYLSKIQGCLLSGAAGDALGYAVKFLHYRDIRQTYGPGGIISYELIGGKARISDVTQMSLFTANGLLFGETRMKMRRVGSGAHTYIPHAYQDWFYTQDSSYKPDDIISWIVSIPELHCHRAPGMACLSALRSGKIGAVSRPLNNSCGCGGVMRVAPIGLFYSPDAAKESLANIVHYGAETAAITHGHPLGYIPAGMMSLMIYFAAFSTYLLPEIIEKSLDETRRIFGKNQYWDEFEGVINKAVICAANTESDIENISSIGKGKLGHEVLAVAIYAALRHELDLPAALIAAVNHDGDSDCAGALCGNILGAYLGRNSLPEEWIEPLELRDTILAIGTDLCDHCCLDDRRNCIDPEWTRKYVDICDLNKTALINEL